MDIFPFQIPTRLTIGPGAVSSLGEQVAAVARRALIVTDPGLVRAGVVEKVQASLSAAGVNYAVFDQVEENPSDSTCEKAAELCRAEGCQAVVGVGGGSSMDTAKVVAALMGNPGKRPQDFEGREQVERDGLPTFMVPTTAGTGSEVTFIAVITDTRRTFKMTLYSRRLAPTAAVLDPLLTLSKPPGLTAATGMDALTHAIESYTNRSYNPISDALSVRAIEMIGRHLRTAVVQGSDVEARHEMLLASLMAGMAFNFTRLGLVHAMSHPLGAHFGIAHGVANAVLLPAIMEFNLFGCIERTAHIARLLGEDTAGLSPVAAARRGVEAVRALARDVGIPERLGPLGVTADRIPAMAEDAMKSGNIPVNPRQVTANDVARLFESLL
ncbi:iron-containing alcohol dehydrogenase [Caldinitratiruptor microaerophilus]|uniref:Alcohol dehydrogenase n=1 Tax=Caldinitratiruptor microaerophilus TaxID=671077 RepID=A0AA35CMN9_9FIRM|nr:iron-containing alcohol dehydrogenase [Caldinitratiruptor microaerophilus]BDG60176.1 alcohol dehydrogenase [Caldinitratiruptor microaerophilus]